MWSGFNLYCTLLSFLAPLLHTLLIELFPWELWFSPLTNDKHFIWFLWFLVSPTRRAILSSALWPWDLNKVVIVMTYLTAFKVFNQLSVFFFSDTAPSHQQGLTLLRASQPLIKYAINTTLQKLKEVLTCAYSNLSLYHLDFFSFLLSSLDKWCWSLFRTWWLQQREYL